MHPLITIHDDTIRMKVPTIAIALACFAILTSGCTSQGAPAAAAGGPVDGNATAETRALFHNLREVAGTHILFGHQDDLAYGVDWWAEDGRSDVRDVAGSYPAVFGWDVGNLERGDDANLDNVNFENMRRWIVEAYERGAVNTIGWHMNNPVTGQNSWDTTRAVFTILPGGEHHETYRRWLDTFADFASSLVAHADDDSTLVPIIFRPYHEMTGSWFWWGKDHTTPEEYKQLWRFTVDYLRDERGVHNLLYAYSTDTFRSEEQYLEHYPGDDYVDLLGFDDYGALRQDDGVAVLGERLKMVVELAEARGKIPALTETGSETIPDPNYWTDRLLAAFKHNSAASHIAYVLIWRNANAERDRPDHFYAPHPGHPSAVSFVEFRNDPLMMFEDDLPDLYAAP